MILNSHTARRGNKVTVYSICRNVQIRGRWRAIEDVLSVQRAGGVYEVRLGDEWIRFQPRAQQDSEIIAASQVGDQLNPWHVGPLLAIDQLGADSLRFLVTRSDGVEYDSARDVLCFKECRELGLAFDVWKGNWPEDVTIDLASGEASLQLAAIRELDAEADGLSRPLDLDPEPVLVPGTFRYHQMTTSPAGDPELAWGILHDTANSSSSGASVRATVTWVPGCAYYLRRSIFNFDTSGLDEPLEAYFKLHRVGAAAGENRVIGGSYGEAALATPSLYGAIANNVAAHTVGAMTEPVTNTLMSPELVGSGHWQALALFRLGLMLYPYDYNDAEPGGPMDVAYIYTISGDNAPRLELTYPETAVPGGTSTSTGTARPKVPAGGHRR